MAQYKVFQMKISDGEHELLNESGWDASPKLTLYCNVKLGGKQISLRDVIDHYHYVATIEADNLEHVFHVGNVGSEHRIKQDGLHRMHSVSVGDVVGDSDGCFHLVKSYGFQQLS